MDETTITKVISVSTDESGKRIFVKTNDGSFSFLEGAENKESILKFVNKSINRNEDIAITFDEKEKVIKSCFWPMRDLVVSIVQKPKEKELMIVTLQMRPSYVLISKRKKNYEELFSLLQSSMKEKKWLLLAIKPLALTIEAAIQSE